MTLLKPTLNTSLAILLGLSLAACSSDDDGGGGPGGGGGGDPAGDALNTYIAKDGGDLIRGDKAFATQASFDTGNDEGLAVDYYGNIFQAGPGSVRVFSNAATRDDLDAFDDVSSDRELTGAATNLMAPKGIYIAQQAGLLLVADFGSSDVKVFGTGSTGDAAPLATVVMPAAPWDLFHDAVADRLFVALTNGTIAVIDNFATGGFSSTIDRTITPVDGAAAQISTNLHGIAYDRANDRIVVTDVGDAGVDDDGSIYTIANASTADGNVEPQRIIEGDATQLGNPVDIALDGERLRVAEKANGGGRLLIFNDLFTDSGINVEPDLSVLCAGAEAIAIQPDRPAVDGDASDLDGPNNTISKILVTVNDGGTNDIRRFDAALNETNDTDTTENIESIDIDQTGDAYVSSTNGAGDGQILVINRGATGRDNNNADDDYDIRRDRVISSTVLVDPKGVEVVGDRGLIMVADIGDGAAGGRVVAFGAQAGSIGNVTPLIDIAVGVDPWDLDYDGENDRLYVALTDGTVAVFDDLLDGAMAPTAPDRTFSVDDPGSPGSQYSVNFHGIVYDASTDRIMLSDVNDAAVDSDGRIFVIENASTASGLMTPSVHIEGPATQLGNPVDLAFDGVDLYVAEKANSSGSLLRFDGIATIDTSVSMDVAPDETVDVDSIESVVLVSDTVGLGIGGSIEED